LSNTLIKWSDIDVHDLDTLIVINVKLLVNNFGRSLDGKRLLRALGHGIIESRGILPGGVIIQLLRGVLLSLLSRFIGTLVAQWLLHLKQLYGWKELSLGEQSVDLPHKLESDIILIQNEGIRVLNDDRDLPPLEEDLELLPVVLLLLVVLCVLKRVHLDVLGEVTRENLCNQEAIVERPKKLGAKHVNTF
jgi:hypothetical protein